MKRTWSAAAGVVAGVVTLGVATLLAGAMSGLGASGGTPSPVIAVGGAFVDRTPTWLKNFAVSTFGVHDKLALFVGMTVVLIVACAVIGILGARQPTTGLVLFVLLGAVGAAAVLSRPAAGGWDILPTVVGTAAGLWALRTLWRDLPGSGALTADPATAPAAAPAGRDHRAMGTYLDRRHFIGLGAALAALGTVAAAAGQRFGGKAQQVLESRRMVTVPAVAKPAVVPVAAQLPVKGITPFIVPGNDFYRIDTALAVPQVDTATWQLRVHGMVDREVTLDWKALLAKPMQESMVTLACVSNEVGGDLVGNAVWTGWPIRKLLALAGVKPGADMVLSTSADGWTAGTPLTALTDGRNALLAVAMNGKPLPIDHGFPVRMVVPGLYGYVSATKWVVDLELTRYAEARAYWTDRGWSAKGPVKTASRIDVPRAGSNVRAGTVAVAGVAWAQHRGIDKVEVRVDDGPWHEARLGAEPTIDAWRQWVYEWEATKGSHTLTVRATDGTGTLQTATETPVVPDGASGWHTVTATVK